MTVQSLQPPALAEDVRYYILREPGNALVPLIPADQLPFQLSGIPRQLSHRQMCEEGWKFVKETNADAVVLSISASHTIRHVGNSMRPALKPPGSSTTSVSRPTMPKSLPVIEPLSPQASMSRPTTPQFLAPDHHVLGAAEALKGLLEYRKRRGLSSASITGAHGLDGAPGQRPATSANYHADPATSLADSFASIYHKDAQRLGYRALPPSGVEPDPTKKEYCTHWIRTGECAFMATGCRFKHEMPAIEKLKELGFTYGVPRWFKEKMAIASRGPTWMERRLNHGKEDSAAVVDAPAMRLFDPSKVNTAKQEEADTNRYMLKGKAEHSRREVPARQALPLLIDIDAPSPSSSPHPSSSSNFTRETSPASSSKSPTCSPRLNLLASSEKNQVKSQPCIRRQSQISWSSEEDSDTELSQQPVERKTTARKTYRPSVKPVVTKKSGLAKSGLAKSKYATGPSAKGRLPRKPAIKTITAK